MPNAENPANAEFFKKVEEIMEYIEKMRSEVEEVKRVQSSILSSPGSDDKLKHQLDDLMITIKKSSNVVRGRLKTMEQEIEKMEESGEASADLRIRKTQHSMLLQKFVHTMTDYNQTQVDYRERCKSRIQRQLEIGSLQFLSHCLFHFLSFPTLPCTSSHILPLFWKRNECVSSN